MEKSGKKNPAAVGNIILISTSMLVAVLNRDTNDVVRNALVNAFNAVMQIGKYKIFVYSDDRFLSAAFYCKSKLFGPLMKLNTAANQFIFPVSAKKDNNIGMTGVIAEIRKVATPLCNFHFIVGAEMAIADRHFYFHDLSSINKAGSLINILHSLVQRPPKENMSDAERNGIMSRVLSVMQPSSSNLQI
jgi:hypothetical protein